LLLEFPRDERIGQEALARVGLREVDIVSPANDRVDNLV
jgi:hypothetical protein